MKKIKWEKRYSLGSAKIDFEHQIFVNLLINLNVAFYNKVEKEYINLLLKEMEQYIIFHFISEENLMYFENFPDIEAHKTMHASLVKEFQRQVELYKSDENTLDTLIGFLYDWFVKHTCNEDMKIANYIKNDSVYELTDDSVIRKHELFPIYQVEFNFLLDDIFNDYQAAIFIYNKKNQLIWINNSTEQFFSFKREDVLLKSKKEIVENYLIPLLIDLSKTEELLDDRYIAGQLDVSFGLEAKETNLKEQKVFSCTRKMIDGGIYNGGRVEFYYDITQNYEAKLDLKRKEESYQKIINNQGDGFIITDSENVITFTNQAAKDLFVSNGGDLLGKKFSCFVDKSQKQILTKEYKKLKLGFSTAFELRVKSTKLEEKILLVSLNPKYDKKNKFVGSYLIFKDISKEYHIKNALEDSESQFRTIYNTMSQGIVYQDVSGVITSANQSAEDILGFSLAEMQQLKYLPTWKEPIKEDLTIFPKEKYPPTLALATAEKVENVLLGFFNPKRNEYRWLKIDSVPLFRKNSDQPYMVYSTFEDVTSSRNTLKELKEAKEKAIEANNLKSAFLANMSHEIRTPMNAIMGFHTILKRTDLNENQRILLNKINNSAFILLELINDILDLSKLEVGEVKLLKTNTNFKDLINEIPLVFSEKIRQKKLDFNVVYDSLLPDFLVLDGFRIKQVINILVSNALKFTEVGGVTVCVSEIEKKNSVKKDRINLKIQVDDTGIGIPDDKMNIIYESFRQLDTKSTKKYGGTGLGLTIAERLIDLMGGSIYFKRKEPGGTSFVVELYDIEIDSRVAKDGNTSKQIKIEGKPKILHVEDIHENRELLSYYLDDEDIELKEAETGESALKIIESYTPDLIIMDIQLPGLNGNEVAVLIKENQSLKHIPIIALSANNVGEEAIKYKSIFDDFLPKPIEQEVLIAKLSKYLVLKKQKETEVDENFEVVLSRIMTKERPNCSQKVLNEIRNSIVPLHQKLTEVLSVDVLKRFTDRILLIGKENNIEVLLVLGKALETSIHSFDFNNINQLLKLFPRIQKYIC